MLAASSHDFFDGLGTEAPLKTYNKPVAEKPTFPCQRCGGSGSYRGARTHQSETKCFTCGGRGYFLKPYADALRDRKNQKIGKANALAERLLTFEQNNPGLVLWLFENMERSQFYRSLHDQVLTTGKLSDKQLAAAIKGRAESDARLQAWKAERQAEAEKTAVVIDLSAIERMFDTALANGRKKLVYRADGLTLKPAKQNSTNPGAIYVATEPKRGSEEESVYLGKVENGKFFARREATGDHKATLAKIAANPSQYARDYGKFTGTCCCCGRELTDPASIAAGIGPICAGGWGY